MEERTQGEVFGKAKTVSGFLFLVSGLNQWDVGLGARGEAESAEKFYKSNALFLRDLCVQLSSIKKREQFANYSRNLLSN